MNLFKEPVKRALSVALLTGSRTRAVFMHHDVSEPDAPQHSELYSTPPALFRAQIEFIARRFEIVSLEELFGERLAGGPRPRAALTFDDGFRSVRANAHAYLSGKGLPYAVFVNGEAVSSNRLTYLEEYSSINRSYRERIYCDEDDLRFLAGAGVLIGNHCHSHLPLAGLEAARLEQEVVGNRRQLERIIGRPIHHLALPYGKRAHYDAASIAACRDSGHRFIYSNNPSTFRSGELHPLHDLIPRIGLTTQDETFLRFIINRAALKKIDL